MTKIEASELITIRMTALEGAMIRLMLVAALEQFATASEEEKTDARIMAMAQTCNNLLPLLPTI